MRMTETIVMRAVAGVVGEAGPAQRLQRALELHWIGVDHQVQVGDGTVMSVQNHGGATHHHVSNFVSRQSRKDIRVGGG